MDISLIIVISSVIMQLLSAIVALRITVTSGKRLAGIVMLLTILLMAFRRAVSLFGYMTEGHGKFDLFAEIIALVISALVLTGVVYMQRLIASLRILSGLLPICSCCKKVRDDKGYWTQIEAYISHRSAAEFSHGICPECADAFYKEYWGEESESGALPRAKRKPISGSGTR